MKRNLEAIKAEREMILEMIEASWELAGRLGKHSLKKGCNCISCVNKRNRLLAGKQREWKYHL